MSSLQYNTGDVSYWSSPRLKKPINSVNIDFNQNNGELLKSVSEPSSPQLWHKVSTTQNNDMSEKDNILQSSSSNGSWRHASLTKQTSERTDLADLLAEHQERQLRSKQGLNLGMNRKWGSNSKMNELHIQTNLPQQSLNGNGVRHFEQIPLKGGATMAVFPGQGIFSQGNQQIMQSGVPFSSTMPTTSAGAYAVTLGQIKEDTPVLRHSPLGTLGEVYSSNCGQPSRSMSPSSDDSDKWSTYLRAKDELIGQKDQIIDRQKQSIFQLQQQLLRQTNTVQPAISQHFPLSRAQRVGDNSSLSLKLQEFQYENAQIKVHLAEKDSTIDKLQKKLGEKEYLLENMEASVKDATTSRRKELEELHQKCAEHEKTQAELKNKLEQLEAEKLKLKQRLCRFPVVFRDVREECGRLKETISSKDKKLSRMNKAFGNKDDEAKKLEIENTALKENVQRLQVSLNKISDDGPVSLINFEDLKMENERLQCELDRTNKMLENKHKKMKALHCQTQKEQNNLQERLAQEEDMVNALREELTGKENTLEEMKKALKEGPAKKFKERSQQIAANNQDLLEENLNLQGSCEQLQKLSSKEKSDVQRKLWKELSDCTSELKAVVQVCQERKEGKDPDMSVMLGLRSTSTEADENESAASLDDISAIKSNLNAVKKLRLEVEGLRKFLSDQYAEDIGNNCRMQ
ncbi:Centrosomal protein of 85 kDa [Acropora cervicornis]|uniref:Centrosomal protein of 85 kDa n=1 Tax=Acropora cervicornis TaxID=6130 RepID=A0AAD9R0M1_ACRCE|nr:Centrosomal protein of 85 kDa [Acropora cervicornis]